MFMENKVFSSFSTEDFSYSHGVDYAPFEETSLHTHDICEIYCIFKGGGNYIVEGAKHKFEYGKLILMRPGEFHRPEHTTDDPYDRLSMHFKPDIVDFFDPDRRLLDPFYKRKLGKDNVYNHSVIASTRIYDIFRSMDMNKGKEYTDIIQFRVLLYSLLVEINNLFNMNLYDTNYNKSKHISEIIEYINKHLSSQLSVKIICDRFFISSSQLNRNFLSYTGSSVWEYITTKRLIHAKKYIQEGMGATEAAKVSGFGDYSSFYKAYKKKYGVTPSGVIK